MRFDRREDNKTRGFCGWGSLTKQKTKNKRVPVVLFVFPHQLKALGLSAKLGPGALWGNHPQSAARFRGSKYRLEVKDRRLPGSKMFQVRVPVTVPSKGPGRVSK